MREVGSTRVLVFDGFEVDLDAAVIRKNGAVVDAEPQVFELIAFLAADHGRLISYDEIVKQVWNGRIVSDAAIATRINAARKALDDDGTVQRVIKTVRGRGLRFELSPQTRQPDGARRNEPPLSVTEAHADSADHGSAMHAGPSIAVLPFSNMSNDPDQEYFADGIVEDIITGLSRVKQFFVIARNSAFWYKGKAVDIRQVGRELGVRYVLEGSVRKCGSTVRITGQLVEANTGHHIWANRFDGDLKDIFELQDLVTSSVIGAIQPSIRAAESSRSLRKRPGSVDAYDLYMQALPHVAALERSENAKGLSLLEQALRLDPSYASALAMAAWCHAQRCVYNWTGDWSAEARRALQLANRAVSHAEDDSVALSMLGAAHTLVREFDTAHSLLERAVELDPNCAWGWNRLGWLNGYRDLSLESIACFERAIRLSPLDSMNFNCFVGIGSAHFLEQRNDDAIRWMEKALAAHPGARWIYRQLVPAYVCAGRIDDAKRALPALVQEYPEITCEKVRAAMLYSAPVMQRICDGLARAGLPHR
jgi:adenylate cyclase